LPPNIVADPSISTRNAVVAATWVYYDIEPKADHSDQSCKGNVIPSHWVDSTDGSKEENVLCIDEKNLTCDPLGYPKK